MNDAPQKSNGQDRIAPVDALLATAPGALRGCTELTLNTRQAQQLFAGRPVKVRNGQKVHPGIIGVRRFATLVRQVLMCARADDPYADQCLVELDRRLASAGAAMQTLIADTESRLAARPAVKMAIAISIKPLVIPLHFQSPYAYQAAYLVADFDLLAAAVLTANHGGLMQRKESEHTMAQGRTLARSVFSIPMRYRFSGATRGDIQRMTARGAAAIEKHGPVAEDILSRKVVPEYGAVRINGEPILDAEVSDDKRDATAAR